MTTPAQTTAAATDAATTATATTTTVPAATTGPRRRRAGAALGAGHPEAAVIALRYLGVPYQWGGASPPPASTAPGLVMYVYAQLGIELPHQAAAQYGYGVAVPRNQLQPGDLVFYDGLSHVGIYIGNGEIVHAPHTGDVVKISPLSQGGASTSAHGACSCLDAQLPGRRAREVDDRADVLQRRPRGISQPAPTMRRGGASRGRVQAPAFSRQAGLILPVAVPPGLRRGVSARAARAVTRRDQRTCAFALWLGSVRCLV